MNTLLRLFLIDWIVDYINTPQYEMTAGCESLFYAALLIICAAIMAIIYTCVYIYDKIKR